MKRPDRFTKLIRGLIPFLTPLHLLATLASAQAPLEAEYEKLSVLGWSKGCSVAVAHYGYPFVGDAIAGEPIWSRVGTLSIEPGTETAKEEWGLKLKGKRTWSRQADLRVKRDLAAMGHTLPGRVETLRPVRVVPERDLSRLLLTTDTFRTRHPGPFPEEPWRLVSVYYAPVAQCALLVYEDLSTPKDFFHPVLVRADNPGVKENRAQSHVLFGRITLAREGAVAALAEMRSAAVLAPDYGLARYHHACLLNINGRLREALDELEAAIKLDPKWKAEARQDKDWEDARSHPRFQEITAR